MQNRDGGWAAFDRDIDNEVLTKVPFADHNAMLDPSCPDITARVLEALGDTRLSAPTTRRSPGPWTISGATQEPHGCWYGRWGVNYIYGTWQVLAGPAGDRLPRWTTRRCRRAADWLESVQQADGGWGEIVPELRRPGTGWAGASRPPRRPPGPSSACSPPARPTATAVRARHRVPARARRARRHLGRGAVHRHRLPAGLLPEVPPVSALLPADGPGPLPGRGRPALAGRPGPWRAASRPRPAPTMSEPQSAPAVGASSRGEGASRGT